MHMSYDSQNTREYEKENGTEKQASSEIAQSREPKKAVSMWFQLADKVAERYRIPFTEIDELAKFMQSAAYQIVHGGKE
jgi:hypothetical protein